MNLVVGGTAALCFRAASALAHLDDARQSRDADDVAAAIGGTPDEARTALRRLVAMGLVLERRDKQSVTFEVAPVHTRLTHVRARPLAICVAESSDAIVAVASIIAGECDMLAVLTAREAKILASRVRPDVLILHVDAIRDLETHSELAEFVETKGDSPMVILSEASPQASRLTGNATVEWAQADFSSLNDAIRTAISHRISGIPHPRRRSRRTRNQPIGRVRS